MDLMGMYILVDNEPVQANDVKEWGEFFESADRVVAKTHFGNVEVSTVFLGLNHNFGIGPPMLFETMVFGGDLDGEMERYSTKEEAVDGHKNFVERVQLSIEGSQ